MPPTIPHRYNKGISGIVPADRLTKTRAAIRINICIKKNRNSRMPCGLYWRASSKTEPHDGGKTPGKSGAGNRCCWKKNGNPREWDDSFFQGRTGRNRPGSKSKQTGKSSSVPGKDTCRLYGLSFSRFFNESVISFISDGWSDQEVVSSPNPRVVSAFQSDIVETVISRQTGSGG